MKSNPKGKRRVFDPRTGNNASVATFLRSDLAPGMKLAGPALVVEPQTTTQVLRGWDCSVTPSGHLMLTNTKANS